MANLAGHVNIGQEVHLNCDGAIAGTILAAATFNVKAKATLLISTHLGLGSLREKRTDFIEYAGVGRRVRSWRTPDRWLINVHNFIQQINASNCAVTTRDNSRTI